MGGCEGEEAVVIVGVGVMELEDCRSFGWRIKGTAECFAAC